MNRQTTIGALAVEAGFAHPVTLALMAAANLIPADELRRAVAFLQLQVQVDTGALQEQDAVRAYEAFAVMIGGRPHPVAASAVDLITEQPRDLLRSQRDHASGPSGDENLLAGLLFTVDRIVRKVSVIEIHTQHIQEELSSMSDAFSTEMAALRADVTAQSTVIASATAAFNGLVAQLRAAEETALGAGATAAQIASVTAIRTGFEANTAALAAAIPANTPAASSSSSASTQAGTGSGSSTTTAGADTTSGSGTAGTTTGDQPAAQAQPAS